MDKLIDVTQKQLLRGKILKLCDELQSTGAGVTLMLSIFRQQGERCSENDITDACRYLHDKGLINFKNYKSDSLNIKRDIAYITSDGVDVLEGTISASGVITEC